MTLNTTEQNKISQDFSREEFVAQKKIANLNKTDIIAAANALDTFINSNLVALNNALPEPFKSTATTQQKLRLFKFVVSRLELQ